MTPTAPSGLPIVAAVRISYAQASVGVTPDGRLEWTGQYVVIEDRSINNSKDHFLFVDSEGNQYYGDQIDWQGVEINLLANES